MMNQPDPTPDPEQPSLLNTENLVHALEEVGCIGAYEFDVATGSIQFSDGMFRLFGEAPGAFVPSLDAIDARSNPEDAERVRGILEQIIVKAQPYEYTRRILKKNGQWAKVESHGKVITGIDGKAVKLFGIVRDITDRSRAEEQLQSSNQMLQATLDSSVYMFQAFKAIRDHEGTIVDFEWILTNKAWNDRYGPMAGKRVLEQNPGVIAAGLFEQFVQVTETGVPIEHEVHYNHEQFDSWFHQTLVKMGDGFMMNTEDITERRKEQQELLKLKDEIAQQAHNKYQTLFNSIDEGFQIIELIYNDEGQVFDYEFRETNPAFERHTGLVNVVGKRGSQVAPGTELQWLQTYHQVLQTGVPLRFDDYNAYTGHWYNTYASRVENDGSNRVAVVFADITERKKAELALRESDERYRAFTKLVPALIWETDVSGNKVSLNLGWLQYTGQTLAETQNGGWLNAVHPDDVQKSAQVFAKCFAGGQAFEAEYRIRSVDGRYHWFQVRQTPAHDEHGQITRWYGAAIDIDRSKQTRLALQQSEQRLAAIFEALPIGVGFANTDGKFKFYNNVLKRYVPTLFMPSKDPERSWRWRAWDENGNLIALNDFPGAQALEGKSQLQGLEILYTQDDGREVWTKQYSVPLTDADGHIIAQLTAITDIDQLKRTSLALQKSEERHSFLLRITDALRPLANPDDIEEVATHLTMEYFGCDRCYYCEVIDGMAIIRRDAARQGLPGMVGRYSMQEMPILKEVISARQALIVNDVTQTELVDDTLRALCLQRQVISFIDVPIIKDDQPAGMLCIVQGTPRQWTDLDVTLAEEVAERVWAATERARAAEAMRLNEQRLRLYVAASSNMVFRISADWSMMYTLTSKSGNADTSERTHHWIDKYIPETERPAVWAAIKQAIATKQTFALEHQAFRADGSVGWVFSRAVPLLDDQGNITEWMGAGNDITQRKEADLQLKEFSIRLEQEVQDRTTELRQTKEMLQGTLNSNPEMIQVFKAVRNGQGSIIDFEWILNNEASELIYGDVIGKHLLHITPGTKKEGVFDRFVEVTESGIPQQYDLFYTHEQFNGWFNQTIVKMGDGVATNTINITERKNAEEAAKDYAYFVKSITDVIPDMLAVVELPTRKVIFNNRDTMALLGYSAEETAGMTSNERRDLFHPDDLPGIQAFYDRFLTLTDHELNQVEYRLKDKEQKWKLLSLRGQVFRRDQNGMATEALFIAQDITLRHEAEQALKQSRDQLQSIFDTTLVGMSVFAPVYDAQNRIVDFRILIVNNEMEGASQRGDLVGQLYSELFPGIKKMGLFDLMVKTYETGEPGKMEYHYTYDGLDRWYSTMYVKGKDSLVGTNLDITERMQAEQERFRNYLLLQQSEQLAKIGSWDFNLQNGVFTWSEGMYRLFGIPHGTDVSPEIYLQCATTDCEPNAKRIITHIRTGDQDFEETLNINVNGEVIIIHLKATVVKNEAQKPIRVLGVDMDITAMREAERRLRHMEAQQQQEIFKVTLNTQEEERRRISESLHNGLGQLLYAAKLSLSMVSANAATDNPVQFAGSRRYTEQLLTDAINESRRISHELMPTVLAEFGLKAAIHDICELLQEGVRFRCQVLLYNVKLDHYLELAVFRTVQELMINVLKHASATQATVQVKARNGVVHIKVQDNGKGLINNKQNKPGIGLSSIRSKAELLKGSVEIWSEPGQGTKVDVRFPYQLFTTFEDLKL
jgi:PAS domain S-box-containing protein